MLEFFANICALVGNFCCGRKNGGDEKVSKIDEEIY